MSSENEYMQRQGKLVSACFKGDLAEVQQIVKEGGQVNQSNKDGEFPLLAAVFNGRMECVQWLVKEAGANVNQMNKFDFPATAIAASAGKLEVARWLVENGAEARGFRVAVAKAQEAGHSDIVQYFEGLMGSSQ